VVEDRSPRKRPHQARAFGRVGRDQLDALGKLSLPAPVDGADALPVSDKAPHDRKPERPRADNDVQFISAAHASARTTAMLK
jgi:hypothetical protein